MVSRSCIFELGLLLTLTLCQGGFSYVTIAASNTTYWGYNKDPELRISADVTTDEAWENVTVSVSTPFGQTHPATTDDESNASTKTYYYVITTLYVDDAGTYTFTAESKDTAEGSGLDSVDILVYVYTVDVTPPAAEYHAVERDEELSVSVYVTTDGSWDDITVELATPGGEPVPTTYSETSFTFWRLYTAIISEIVTGTYEFVANETLGGKPHTVLSQAVVTVYETSPVDEYLYRFNALRGDITSQVSDFYEYIYDGPDNTYIRDGGNDMYDRGNYVTISSSNSETVNIPYGKPHTFNNYVFSSKPTYPFTSLVWIGNRETQEDQFSIQVRGSTGTLGTGSSETFENTVAGSYTLWYKAFQVYGAGTDPSICEVYFTLVNPDVWGSTPPTSITMTVGGLPTRDLNNTLVVTGSPANMLMGYTLLSKLAGELVTQAEVEAVIGGYMDIIYEKDGFTVTSEPVLALGVAEQATISTTVTMQGSWDDYTVTLARGNDTLPLTFSDVDANTRVYEHVIASVTTEDAVVYTFSAVDGYGFVQTSTTRLDVLTSEIFAPTTEYWAVDKDPELVLTVEVTSDDWTDLLVMVTRPDLSVLEATTVDTTTNGTRNYTHVVTNLFIEDAGEYIFQAFRGGRTASAPTTATVYLFTIHLKPDLSEYHTVDKDTEVMITFAGSCEGSWDNVYILLYLPDGSSYPPKSEETSFPFIRIFTAPIFEAVNGTYTIKAFESLASNIYQTEVTLTMEIYETTDVDEYLYRIRFASDSIVSNIPDWYDYRYDGPDNTYIADGGNDMYDRGNYVSYSWSTGEETNIPYGKPFTTNDTIFSSKYTYPFVTLMWINNEEGYEEEFAVKVAGNTGTAASGKVENYRGYHETYGYEVSYEVVQVYGTADPSICEVYFTVSNEEFWSSVKPSTFNVTVGAYPPDTLENTARVYGSPKNIMLGYTLLSKHAGVSVTPTEVANTMNEFVDLFYEREYFGVSANTADSQYVSYLGEDATISALVTNIGSWFDVLVEITYPDGTKETLNAFTYDEYPTTRMYSKTIASTVYADKGDYTLSATDEYGEKKDTVATLHIFTIFSYAKQSEYPAKDGDRIVMEIQVMSEVQNSGMLVVEIDTPTLGTLPVDNMSIDWMNNRTYRYIIESADFARDNGNYVFHVNENYKTYSYSNTVATAVGVFSSTIVVAPKSYTIDKGGDLELTADVTHLGDWGNVKVGIYTPGRDTPEVTEYDTTSDSTTRTYKYLLDEATSSDAGSYRFFVTETLYGESRQENSDYIVEVIVKAPKLTGGEIAGIVIGSIVGVALIVGLLWYCFSKKGGKVTMESSDGTDISMPENTVPEKSADDLQSEDKNLTQL